MIIDEKEMMADNREITESESAKNLAGLNGEIKVFLQDFEETIKRLKAGNVDARFHPGDLQGVFAGITQGLNEALDQVTNPVTEAVDIINQYARGDLSREMRKLSGKQAALSDGVNAVRSNFSLMVADAEMLARAAVEGRLATRADASKHQGDFRQVVQGVNDTMDALIGPLLVTAQGWADLYAGMAPQKITADWKGDYNKIKENINNEIAYGQDA